MKILSKFARFSLALFVIAPGVPTFAAEPMAEPDVGALTMERDALRAQLNDLRSENTRCEKQRTGWTVATIVGGIGVVGTTAGAIYQGVDLKNKRDELKGIQGEITTTQSQIDGFPGTGTQGGR